MAVGLPAKTTYADGDVFSASDINDTNGTINLIGQTTNFYAGKNRIINGDMGINQRNFTSNTTNGQFCFDRFFQTHGGSGTVTVTPQTFTPGTAPVSGYESRNFVRYTTASGTTTSTFALFVQKIEDVRTFAGQTITVSFWAKAGSGTPKLSVEIEQSFGSGGSATVGTSASAAFTLSTSWARYSTTINIPSITGKTIGSGSSLFCNIWTSAGSDFNSRANSIGIQNNSFDIWGIQAEAGSTATAFQTSTGTLQGELAACQRYYWRIVAGPTYQVFSNSGWYASSTQFEAVHRMPVSMRIAPTSLDFAGTLQVLDTGGGGIATSSGSISGAESNPDTVRVNWTVSGATSGRFGNVRANNSATAYVGFSAEL
jgi:hypothetical protein